MKEKFLLDEFGSSPKSLDIKTVKKKRICTRCKQTYEDEATVVNGHETWKICAMCEQCRRELVHSLNQK